MHVLDMRKHLYGGIKLATCLKRLHNVYERTTVIQQFSSVWTVQFCCSVDVFFFAVWMVRCCMNGSLLSGWCSELLLQKELFTQLSALEKTYLHLNKFLNM